MEILCLFIPHLPVQWEVQQRAAREIGPVAVGAQHAVPLRGTRGDAVVPERQAISPNSLLIIGGFPHERKTVLDCSEKAAASGVHPGMSLREASHRCPGAIFLPVDEAGYAHAFEEVLDILDRFSPTVETGSLGKAFLDVTGTEQLFGPATDLAQQISRDVLRQTGFKSQIGVAASKFVASIAASLASTSPLVVRNGEEKTFLEALSVELLPISQEALAWLKRLGLRHMGQVADMPGNALASQMGAEGMTAHRLANGLGREPVRPRARPDILEHTLSFETPLESLDALLAAIDKLLDQLVPLLRKRYQVCGQVRLCFHPDAVRSRPDVVSLKMPLDSKPEILGILKRHLETATFPEGISEVCLGLGKLGGESGKQPPLSSGSKGRQEAALERLEKDLGDRFGHGSLKKVVALDPDSRIPERRVALVDANTDGQR